MRNSHRGSQPPRIPSKKKVASKRKQTKTFARRDDQEIQEEHPDGENASLKNTYGAIVQWGDQEGFDYGPEVFGMNEWPAHMGSTMVGFRPSKFEALDLGTKDGRPWFETNILKLGALSRTQVDWQFKNWE